MLIEDTGPALGLNDPLTVAKLMTPRGPAGKPRAQALSSRCTLPKALKGRRGENASAFATLVPRACDQGFPESPLLGVVFPTETKLICAYDPEVPTK